MLDLVAFGIRPIETRSPRKVDNEFNTVKR